MTAAGNLISVIIPCYNAERYVREALDSVVAQTYRPLEIILVDDGCTDRTVELGRACHPDVVVVRHEKNLGLNHARNTGLARARGTYIQFLDSDDMILPDKLERQAAALDADPTCDVVFSDVHEFHDSPDAARPEAWREHKERKDYLGAFLVVNAMAPHAPLIRRSCAERAKGFSTDFSRGGEDWDFWIRICLQGSKFTFVPGVLALYRKHAGSMCGLGFNCYDWEPKVMSRAIQLLRDHDVKEPERWHAVALGLCRLALFAQWKGLPDEAARFVRQAAAQRPPIHADLEQHSYSEFGARMSTSYLGLSKAMLEAGATALASELGKISRSYWAVSWAPTSAEQAMRRRFLNDEMRLCRQMRRDNLTVGDEVAEVFASGATGNDDELALDLARFLDELGQLERHQGVLRAATRASEQAAVRSLLRREPNRLSSKREWLLLRARCALLRAGFVRGARALALMRRSKRAS